MKNNIENELATELLKEHKRSRRWKNARFFVWLAILLIYSILFFSESSEPHSTTKSGNYVSLVEISGAIMPHSENSADSLGSALENAFSDTHAKGVVLLINSPGGAAVQSAILHDQILRLKKQY